MENHFPFPWAKPPSSPPSLSFAPAHLLLQLGLLGLFLFPTDPAQARGPACLPRPSTPPPSRAWPNSASERPSSPAQRRSPLAPTQPPQAHTDRSTGPPAQPELRPNPQAVPPGRLTPPPPLHVHPRRACPIPCIGVHTRSQGMRAACPICGTDDGDHWSTSNPSSRHL